MSGPDMLTVEQALATILATAPEPLEREWVPLATARGRTLASDVLARRSQPPVPVSAMDGYAVRAADLLAAPAASLRLIGTSAAGRPFAGALGAGETVRIFTGAALPAGADTVLMQENARADGPVVLALQAEPRGRHVRGVGLDFSEGDVLPAGRRLGASDLALAAAMNHPRVPVIRAPRVAILATGDELVPPGTEPGPASIVASNNFAVAAIVEAAGGVAIDLGIARDDYAALAQAFDAARVAEADVLVTLGGASVGDHDLVQEALRRQGMTLGFWKVALRPGKPLMHGRLGDLRVLGLPGNPVSAIICGVLFVRPLVRALSGDRAAGLPRTEPARLAGPLPANKERQDFMRARMILRDGEIPEVEAAAVQDSSMLRVMAMAEALIVRAPHAAPAEAGDPCAIIRLDRLLG